MLWLQVNLQERAHLKQARTSHILCPRLAILMVLYSFRALMFLGVECGTFIFMNSGSSRRSPVTPMGDTAKISVSQANRFASRPGPVCKIYQVYCICACVYIYYIYIYTHLLYMYIKSSYIYICKSKHILPISSISRPSPQSCLKVHPHHGLGPPERQCVDGRATFIVTAIPP